MPNFLFNIDVLGSCNLKCPSCPVGNFTEARNPTGFMSPTLLDQIMKKATLECRIAGIQLFNWTEPLLHPQLAELVKIIQSYGVACGLSSNLNILKNVDDIMTANPHNFRISVSGFNQSIYGTTHRGGDIERVKKNMIALAESKAKTGSTTIINVLYHRYLGNLDDELLMKEFSENLGFNFESCWSFMMPLEKILAYINEDVTETILTDEDLNLIQKLSLPLREAIDVSQKYKENPCQLRDGQMTLDFQGNVQLCCGVFDSSKFTLGSFLSLSVEDLQTLKYQHSMCVQCMDKGVHVYGVYGAEELDSLAINNIILYYARQLGVSTEIPNPEPESIDLAQLTFNELSKNNLIVFPNWQDSDEKICKNISSIIRQTANFTNKQDVRILIDTNGVDRDDASLIISAILMEIVMEGEIEINEETEDMFVLTNVNNWQDSNMFSRISGRVILDSDYEASTKYSDANNLATINIEDLSKFNFDIYDAQDPTKILALI